MTERHKQVTVLAVNDPTVTFTQSGKSYTYRHKIPKSHGLPLSALGLEVGKTYLVTYVETSGYERGHTWVKAEPLSRKPKVEVDPQVELRLSLLDYDDSPRPEPVEHDRDCLTEVEEAVFYRLLQLYLFLDEDEEVTRSDAELAGDRDRAEGLVAVRTLRELLFSTRTVGAGATYRCRPVDELPLDLAELITSQRAASGR